MYWNIFYTLHLSNSHAENDCFSKAIHDDFISVDGEENVVKSERNTCADGIPLVDSNHLRPKNDLYITHIPSMRCKLSVVCLFLEVYCSIVWSQ